MNFGEIEIKKRSERLKKVTFRFFGEVVVVGGGTNNGDESHRNGYHLRPVRLYKFHGCSPNLCVKVKVRVRVTTSSEYALLCNKNHHQLAFHMKRMQGCQGKVAHTESESLFFLATC